MQDVWDRIHSWLEVHAPIVVAALPPGASEAQIQEAEQYLGVQLPEDVKASYRIHDGGPVEGYSFLDTDQFYSLEGVKSGWQTWKDILDEGVLDA